MPLSTVAFSLQRGRKTEIRAELNQRRQRGNHLLGTGGKRHLLTMIINSRRGRANLLHHQREVGAGRKLFDVFVNIRGLNAERLYWWSIR